MLQGADLRVLPDANAMRIPHAAGSGRVANHAEAAATPKLAARAQRNPTCSTAFAATSHALPPSGLETFVAVMSTGYTLAGQVTASASTTLWASGGTPCQ